MMQLLTFPGRSCVAALEGARDPEQAMRARQRITPWHQEPALEQMQKAVCEPARLRILQALSAGPLSVDDLARVVERSPTVISQHLRVLRDLGLVEAQRRGTFMYYRLRPGPATDSVQAILRDLAHGVQALEESVASSQ